MWQSPKRLSISYFTTATLRVCGIALYDYFTHQSIDSFSRPVFYNALLAMLNAREKLARLEINNAGRDLHVFHPSVPSGDINHRRWRSIAGILPFPCAGILKGPEKRTTGERIELSGRRDPTSFGRSSRWESNGGITYISSGTGSGISEDAYPKGNKEVGSVIDSR